MGKVTNAYKIMVGNFNARDSWKPWEEMGG
jgi:hypothetical protein